MIECTCAREKILTICDSKKINILKIIIWRFLENREAVNYFYKAGEQKIGLFFTRTFFLFVPQYLPIILSL